LESVQLRKTLTLQKCKQDKGIFSQFIALDMSQSKENSLDSSLMPSPQSNCQLTKMNSLFLDAKDVDSFKKDQPYIE
jgi:hypothetical protein